LAIGTDNQLPTTNYQTKPLGLGGGHSEKKCTADDHEEAEDLEGGDGLAEGQDADNGDQGGAHPSPDGVDDAHFQGFQGLGYEGETAQVEADHPDGGEQAAKAMGKFQAYRAADFQQNGQGEDDPRIHRGRL
jgi:hypothetical protein